MVNGETGPKGRVKEGCHPPRSALGEGLVRKISGFKTVRLKKVVSIINKERVLDDLILISYSLILLGVLLCYGR